MKTAYSTNGLKHHTLDQAFGLIKAHGYDFVELSFTAEHFNGIPENEYAETIQKLIAKHKISVSTIHTGEPFILSQTAHYPSLISSNDQAQKRILFLQKMIVLAKEINCQNVCIVSGCLEENQDKTQAKNQLEKNIRVLLNTLPLGVQLLIEQEPEMFIANTNDLLELIQTFEAKLKINLDVGHLNVINEDIVDSMQILKNHIHNIHIEDIENHIHKHLIPGEGQIDFQPMFKQLAKSKYKHTITADLYPFSHIAEQALSKTAIFFKKNIVNSN